jgi:hypothetical protein
MDAMTKPSPFLPGTHIQYAFDSTSLGWLKECPRKYFYSMIEGWRTKSDSVHLDFGRHYHAGLELYDRLRAEGRDHEESVATMVGEALAWTWADDKPWAPDHASKNRETLIRSLIWYVEQFKDDPAKTVILANGKPAVELSFKLELNRGPAAGANIWKDGPEGYPSRQPYILCGHMDRVVEYLDGTYVTDRKTSSSTITSNYFDQYNPDNQMSLYTLASRVIYLPIRGIIIDAAQIAVGFTRFSRGFTHRTESQLEEWLEDSYHWFSIAEGFARDGYWPMNDKSCHKYGGCPFRRICSKSPEVRATFLATDFYKQEWNPLVPR